MVLTQYGTIDSAVEATRLGAVDYVTKPFRIEELKTRLERAAHSVDLRRENGLLREQLRTCPGFGGLIGLSPKMESVYKVLGKVNRNDDGRLPARGLQRLETIAALAVRLRETIRRLSQEWEVRNAVPQERS